MNRGVLRFAFRQSWFTVVLAGVCLVLLGAFFAAFYAGVRPDRTMAGILKAVPALFRSFLGGRYLDLVSPPGFLAMNYKHPLVLLCVCGAAVTVASRSLAGEISRGTIDLLLTHPVRRGALVAATALVLTAAAGLLSLALWLGHLIGIAVFGVPIEGYASRFLPVVVHAAAFALFVGALSLLVSAASATRGRAVGVAVGLLGLLLFVDFGARVYEPLRWMEHVTPFGYFTPAKVVRAGEVLAGDVAGLLAGGAALTAAAGVVFGRRQIP